MTVLWLFLAALAFNVLVAVALFFRPDAAPVDEVPADVAEVWAEAEALTRGAA